MPVRKNVYLLFKEAMNNMEKYSNASQASFHITLENRNVKMVIHDNGLGFDIETAKMGNGIKNMKRRASEIGAQFLIESAEGKGTTIELSFKDNTMEIKVVIFEDNNNMREGLYQLINGSHGFICTGAFPNCDDLVRRI
jgi:nitrate/nitrite-specific signal transduction histidine kinase